MEKLIDDFDASWDVSLEYLLIIKRYYNYIQIADINVPWLPP